MIRWIKHYIWFTKTSQSFMKGYNPIKVFFQSLHKGIRHANNMCMWDSWTPEQREAWYLSGEGRIIEF